MMNNTAITALFEYFPELNEVQREQMTALGELYADWNGKINVISRKDIDNLYIHHVLHSLGIVKMLHFKQGTTVMDLGSGGGFPGIPLAIYFPDAHFHLVDSIGKKIKVAQAVAESIGLKNVSCKHGRGEEEKELFDFVVSRAVMPLPDLVTITAQRVNRNHRNALPNGLVCLKGGELEEETKRYRKIMTSIDLETYFKETYFHSKKVVYIPV